MDTLAFLQAILPETGVYYLALFSPEHQAPAHKAYTSLEDMATAVAKYDGNPALAVYHACASYKEPSIIVDGKKTYRKPANWDRAKALWIDIDCGEDKAAKQQGYLTKLDAVGALYGFCNITGFPKPMVVDSGNGVHCYWPLTKSIRAASWQALAGKLRDVLAHFEVLVDTTCTADFARVLRPAGSTNRKRDPKLVQVKTTIDPLTPELVRDLLANIVSTYRITGKDVAQYSTPAPGINDDLMGTSNYPQMESSAKEVANRCAQVALMRDTKGDVSYDHWRGVIGLIKHCTEGITLAREWSEERANTGHESNDVLTRFETWSAGPPTCEFFSKTNPGACDGCAHKGKIKSPIMLGRLVPEPEEKVVEALVDGRKVAVEIPKFPAGYKWENDMLTRFLQDKDGIWHPFPFSASLFYPIHRAHREDGSYCMGLRMHLPDGRTRQFDVSTGLLASPQKLLEELARAAEIVQTNTKDAPMHLTAYLRDGLEQLKAQAEELNTMTSFGWKHDLSTFLIGDRLYQGDGTMRKVLVGGYAADYLSHFPTPRGTLNGYAQALNHVYSRPGMEPMQYAICSGFGSVLTPFGENLYRGLLVALTGGETARGKSTVCQAAMYAFGDAHKMTVKTEKGSTGNAQYAQMGTYGSIPMLFDEYTGIEPQAFSEFAYRVSLGEEKGRMTVVKSGGIRKASQVEWSLSPYVTANKDLHAILSMHSANSQAEAVRMVQIRVDDYDIPQFGDGEVDSALKQMQVNSGPAGEAFVQYVVAHRENVFALFQSQLAKLSPHIPGPKYRYYRNHAAATLAAATILHTLGIVTFNLDALFVFTIRLMKKLSDAVIETNMLTPEDALSLMINELSPRIVSTVEYRETRDARGPERVNRVFAAVAGRYILGGSDKKEKLAGKLYIVRKDMKDWCQKQRIDLVAVLDYAASQGMLLNDNEKFTLTRGTELPSINARCVCLDIAKMVDAVGQPVKLVVHTNKIEPDASNAVAV